MLSFDTSRPRKFSSNNTHIHIHNSAVHIRDSAIHTSQSSLPEAHTSLVHAARIHSSSVRKYEKEKDMRGADPKVSDIGRAIEDDFATIRECYGIFSL